VRFLLEPWAWWVEPFLNNPFMRNALWAGILTAVITSVVGTWVVLRGLAFLGDALAHGVLPGIAIAFILGINTSLGAFIAALVMVAGVSLVRTHSPLPDDTSIGVLFVGFLALAVVILSSQLGSYTGDLNRFLFGSITAATGADITQQVIAAAFVVGASVVFYRAFLAMTFDEIQAQMLGLRPKWANLGLLGLIAIAIVSSFETVGSLLVFAFLIAPPAAATLIARRVPWVMVTAVLIGALSVVIGILISYHYRSAAGASMALVSVIIFFVVLAYSAVKKNLSDRSGSLRTNSQKNPKKNPQKNPQKDPNRTRGPAPTS
jgi:ABC-type Mn2+/Zn2+ transport system permease subunit